jgi:nucleoside 2-deoxyribosyltransferase
MKLDKNQKVFLSYAWTGEDTEFIIQRVSSVVRLLESNGINTYCNFDDPATKEFSEPGQFVKHALEKLRTCDILLVIVSSERRSLGQLMEIGAALYAGKPVITAMHTSSLGTGYLENNKLVDDTFSWNNETELLERIEGLL